jgi:anti-anti-sigma factor
MRQRQISAGEPFDEVSPVDRDRFDVDVRWHDAIVTVRPRGDLDPMTVPALRAALDRVEGARRVVLDLSRVSFIDSAGVHLLVGLDDRAQREGFRLALVPPMPPADLAIELCGLYETLPFTRVPGPRRSRAGRSRRRPVRRA